MSYKTVGALLALASTVFVAVLLYQEEWLQAGWLSVIAIVGITGGMLAQQGRHDSF